MQELMNGAAIIVPIVMALSQWVKTKLDIRGQDAEIVSFLIGFGLGIGYHITEMSPEGFPAWFGAVLFGISMGLVPSGLYKFIKT